MQRFRSLPRLADAAWMMPRYIAMRRRDRWPPAKLLAFQRRRFLALLAHATARSPFYRQLYRGLRLDDTLDIRTLPTITKRDVVERFDEMVTDPRLKLAEIEAHLATAPPESDDLHLGEYRILATAGTSGLRGVFVFDRAEWRTELANVLRWLDFIGARPTLFPRPRISVIGAPSAVHVSRRLPLSGDFGLFRLQYLAVTSDLATLVAALGRFRPDILLPYPTIARLLAAEQLAGRLAISPRIVSTHSELLTRETRRLIEAAWRVTPFDHYGLTELATFAVECDRHLGLHMLNDLFIAEIVDDRYDPVPPGEAGSRVLLTSLVRFVQPLIRYEISDRLRLSPTPCPCGRPFPLITEIEGRDEECLSLPGAHGPVAIPPLALSAILEGLAGIREFRLDWDGARLLVTVAPAENAGLAALRSEVASRLAGALADLGAVAPEIAVSFTDHIDRRAERMGKVRIVETGRR